MQTFGRGIAAFAVGSLASLMQRWETWWAFQRGDPIAATWGQAGHMKV
jgi:hypothetical protein